MIKKYFELQERQTNFRIEFIAGLTTFLTMAYIISANPNILSDKTGMNKEAGRPNRPDFGSYGPFISAGTIIRTHCSDSAAVRNRTGSYYGRPVYDEGS